MLNILKDLYPAPFRSLEQFCRENMNFDDPVLLTFASEVQFYLSWLAVTDSLREKGLCFCIPSFAGDADATLAEGCFDMALAMSTSRQIVENSFRMDPPERLMVITGPNQGGKTTFARMYGQLHYLAGLGLSVPARRAVLRPCSAVLTLFQKEEDINTLNGQLQDELERLKAMLDRADSSCVIVINEIFASTTADDALTLGRRMMGRLCELDAPGVIVTFLDELSEYSEKVVSMMSVVTSTQEHERTFRIVRKPADGLAYAINIARDHGLTYDRLKERLS